jgi:Ca2+-binding RTX toxin-like protein
VQANEDDDIITIAAGVSLQNATINGNQGNDILLIAANSANPETRIYGGNGNDTLNATTSSANLNLTGDGGDDSIRGGLGNDRLTGGEGNDDIRGGDGDDTINGDDGNDTIFANQGNDLIHGGTGNDDIQAGQGDDSVDGGSGNDTIDGGTTGNDWLNGDTGNDTLTGSTGNDTLSGGSGNDDFIFSTIPTNGSDTITDFNLNQGDRMNISGTTVSALANTTAGTAITLNTTAELEDQLNPIAIASLRNFVARTANHTDIDSINDVVAALGNGGAMDAVDLADNGINTLVLSGADNTTTTYVYGYTGDGAPGYLANEFWLLATVTTNTTTFLASTFVY